MTTGTLVIIGVCFLLAAILFTIPTMKQRGLKSVIDVFSEGITSISFLVIFVVFMAQIIARYFFKTSIGWSNEVSILGYMYCMYFGTGRALSADEHVVFSLVYDKLPNKGKLFCKLLCYTAMIVLLALTISPSFKAIMKMTNVTGVLKMPYKVVFFPYMWLLIESIIRSAFCIRDAFVEYKENSRKEAKA